MADSPLKKRAPYRIETARLVLRPHAPEDAELLRITSARCKDHLLEFIPWARFDPQTLDEKLELILGFRAQFDAGSNFIYGIFDAASGDLMGGTGLHPRQKNGPYELGYWITPEAEGRGFVSEASRALCVVAFENMGFDMLAIRMEPLNVRSENVAIKLGFAREGILRNSIRFSTDSPKDALRYSLLESEYQAQPWRDSARKMVRAFDALQRPIWL